jgi:chromosome segregation ATPase
MTDKAMIQPKSKPEKTTISISGETSERLEIYCRANGILRKEFVSLALDYFERTGFDLKSNALDYSPLEKIIGELKEVKTTMQTSNEGTEAVRQLLQAVREQTAKQLPAPEIIAQAAEEKAKAESRAEEQEKELRRIQEENNRLRNEIKDLQAYKEKAHRELCRVRDEQKTFGKIHVNTDL